MKSNNILAPTAIQVLLPGLYRYGIAVTTRRTVRRKANLEVTGEEKQKRV